MLATYTEIILITGGTTGLGYDAALQFAQKRPENQIIIASRTDKEHAADSINKTTKQKNVVFMPLDLGSFDHIRAFVSAFASQKYPLISILVQNAGLQFHNGIHFTEDGIETTFGVNHVGHALLFFLLKPCLAKKARIVVTSSGTHDPAQKTMVPDAEHESAELLAHPVGDKADPKWSGMQRYSSSKLANVLWMYALERHLLSHTRQAGKNWTVAAIDPGLMPGTSLGRDLPWPVPLIAQHILPHMLWLLKLVIRSNNVHSTKDSAAALVRLGLEEDSDVKNITAKYFEGVKEIQSSVDSYNESKQDDLWNWTVEHIARNEKEKAQFLSV